MTAAPSTAKDIQLDKDQANKFLIALGKNGDTRMRGFSPWKGNGRKDTLNSGLALQWQQEGLGLYVVINNGGDNDDSINNCVAIFCEWDDKPIDWQKTAWQELGLPEPSLQVDSGGKSIHNYWVFNEPIAVDQWRNLQERLIAHTHSDPKLKNPSRVMRLPGTWHLSTGATHPDVVIDRRVEVVHTSEHRYSFDDLDSVLKPLPKPEPQTPHLSVVPSTTPSGTVHLSELLPKDQSQTFSSGVSEGGRNEECYRLAVNLLGIEMHCSMEGSSRLGFHVQGSAADCLEDFNRRCSPPLSPAELQVILSSASQSNPEADPGVEDRIRYHRRRLNPTQAAASKNLPSVRSTPEFDELDAELKRETFARFHQAQQVTIDPLSILGSEWGQLIIDRAEAFPCDPDVLVVGLLAYIASLVGTKVTIQVKTGWPEPLVLWAMCCMPAGSMKSPTGSVYGSPLRELQSKAEHQWQLINNSYQADLKEFKQQEKQLKNKAKDSGIDSVDLGSPPVEPEPVRPYYVDNATIERLGEICAQPNVPGLLTFKDELAEWFASFERYSKGGGDRPKWLALWNGGAVKSDTLSRGCTFAAKTAVSVFGYIQQEKLAALLADEAHQNDEGVGSGDGLWSRFLPLVAKNIPFDFNWLESDITPQLISLAEQLDRIPTDSRIDITPEAINDVLAPTWRFWTEKEQESSGARGAFLSKLRGYSIRIAGILQLLQDPSHLLIENDIALRAVLLCEFFLAQFDQLQPQVTASDDDCQGEVDQHTARLLQRVKSQSLEQVTVRDVVRWKLLGRRAKSADAHVFLQRIAGQGIGSFVQVHKQGSARGSWAWLPGE